MNQSHRQPILEAEKDFLMKRKRESLSKQIYKNLSKARGKLPEMNFQDLV